MPAKSKVKQESFPVHAETMTAQADPGLTVSQAEDFVGRHPAESVAMAAAAGVVTGIALGAAPKATAKVAAVAMAGAAAAGFVKALRADWGMTLETFARLTGYAVRSITAWEGGTKIGKNAMRTLTKVQRLREALARVMRPEFIGQWMDTPNPAFGGMKPLEVWERGEEDRIWAMIFYLESGIPS
jgi:DNA-binding transcriptional regulator YiaG